MDIAVAQLGARRHYAVPRILHRAGMLGRLFTDTCAVKGWPQLLGIIPPSLRPPGVRRLLGRVPRGIPTARITAFNWLGIEYSRRLRDASTPTQTTAANLWSADRFSELILRHGLGEVDAIHGLNILCTHLFRDAKHLGYKIVVEQVSIPPLIDQRLVDTELSDAEEWGQVERDDLVGDMARREQEAWSLADLVLCGSEFVRQGVVSEGGPAEKCVVVPYGVDRSSYAVGERIPREAGEPLRVLFVGNIGPRKGIRHLFAAMRELADLPVQCRVVGGFQVSQEVLRRHALPNVELVGRIPRAEVAREYARADIFCFPSLSEGSAAVIYEALAAGLPVITTHNAGSIVRDGLEGFIVPIQDSHAIATCLQRLALDRELLRAMSIAARERSAFGSMEAYGQRLLEALQEIA